MATSPLRPDYDVVIAGGGMIGASLALALTPLGLRTLVVEAVAPDSDVQPSFDDRSTALSRSTQRMYAAMGLWEALAPSAAPIRRVHISDRGRFGFAHIDAAQQRVEALGHVVINHELGELLRQRIEQEPSIEVACPATISGTSMKGELVSVALTGGDPRPGATARLLVAADGAQSTVRQLAGIGATATDYGQQAIVGNVLPERDLQDCAYERFTDEGPLAILPVPGGRAGFVWTVASGNAEQLLGLDDAAFLAALQQAFGYRLGGFSRVGKRGAYPLTLSRALRLTAPRTVLVGNAAHGLHPVAAQGFNLGMRDVAALCDCIDDAISNGSDIGHARVLDAYAAWRRRDQGTLLRLTDGIVRLFGSARAPAKLARDVGMIGFDLVPGIRTLFARRMMGLTGRLPRLSRGVPLS